MGLAKRMIGIAIQTQESTCPSCGKRMTQTPRHPFLRDGVEHQEHVCVRCGRIVLLPSDGSLGD